MIPGFKIGRIELFLPELKKRAFVLIVLNHGEPSDGSISRAHPKKIFNSESRSFTLDINGGVGKGGRPRLMVR